MRYNKINLNTFSMILYAEAIAYCIYINLQQKSCNSIKKCMSYKDCKSALYFGIKMTCALHNRKRCNIVHYKLRITTASAYLCVQILSARPLRSISGCSSGIVIVLPSHLASGHADLPSRPVYLRIMLYKPHVFEDDSCSS